MAHDRELSALGRILSAAFFFAVLLFLLIQFGLILAPFGTAIFLAIVIVVTFNPLTVLVRARVNGSRTSTAVIMSVVMIASILVPSVVLMVLLFDESASAHASMEKLLGGQDIASVFKTRLIGAWKTLTSHFPRLASLDISSMTLDASKQITGWLGEQARALPGSIAAIVTDGGMMLLAVFVMFRDGDRMLAYVEGLLPMDPTRKARVTEIIKDTLCAVVQSSMLIGLVQGLLAGLGYWLIGGFSASLLLGFLSGVASLVPLVGTALVWVPAAVFLMVNGDMVSGLLLCGWGVVVIGSVDNFLRPMLIGGRVQMPSVVLLFALLGGLQVYGFLGIFLAPVVVAVLIAFIQIYREVVLDAAVIPAAGPAAGAASSASDDTI